MRVRFDAAPAHAGAAARASLPLAKARAIFNNLRKLSAAADQYYLLNGTTTTAYANLVGPNVFIGSLPSGEDYSTIVFNQKNLVYLVTTAGGVTVALDLSHGGTADESTFYPPKPGDTLATIARRVGKSPQDLAGLNEIPYPPLGPIGDVLRVR